MGSQQQRHCVSSLPLQVASKLQLVSSFVAAHSIGQQVFNAHFAGRTADGNNSNGNKTRDAEATQQARAGFASDPGDADVEQQVLRESRAEADAALQYAHDVSG